MSADEKEAVQAEEDKTEVKENHFKPSPSPEHLKSNEAAAELNATSLKIRN